MGRKLVIGGGTVLLGLLACAWCTPAIAKEDPLLSFDGGKVAAAQPPSEAELMYEAMKRSGRGSKNDAAIDRAIARAQKDSEKNRKALRMELAARAWKDPFVDDAAPRASSGNVDDEVGAARAEAARARKETARARADAAVARREAARAKSDAARVETEAIAQADAALARAEAARVEAAAARTDALAARASCAALPFPGEGGMRQKSIARKTFVTHTPKRFPSMGRARLASVTVNRPTQPVEAPPPALPPAIEELPKAALATTSGTANGAPSSGFIVVPIPPPPPTQGRAGRRP